MKPPLSPQQQKVYTFIVETIARTGKAPTQMAIAVHLGCRAWSAVSKHIERLVAKGYLEKGQKWKHWNIRVVGARECCPTCGQVVAAQSVEAAQS